MPPPRSQRGFGVLAEPDSPLCVTAKFLGKVLKYKQKQPFTRREGQEIAKGSPN
jgi:hypothetical protein